MSVSFPEREENWVKIGSADEIDVGGVKSYEWGVERRIAIFRLGEEQFYALDDLCTHANARLSEGFIEEGCVACPWHGALFDIETGEALTPPAVGSVKTYRLESRGSELWICD